MVELERSVVFVETREDVALFSLIDWLKDFGNVKVNKVRPMGFWCQFIDIADDKPIKGLMAQV